MASLGSGRVLNALGGEEAMSAIASIGGASPLDCRLRLERVALLSLALSLLCTLTSLTHIATVNVVLAVYGLVVASPRVSTLQPRTFFLFGGALAMSILTDALLVFAELLWFLHGWNVIELLGLALCAVLKGSQLHSALVLYDHLGGTVDDVRAQVPGLDAAMPYLSSVAAATPGQRPRPRRSDFIDVERGSSPGQSGNSGGSSHTTPTASARKPMRGSGRRSRSPPIPDLRQDARVEAPPRRGEENGAVDTDETGSLSEEESNEGEGERATLIAAGAGSSEPTFSISLARGSYQESVDVPVDV